MSDSNPIPRDVFEATIRVSASTWEEFTRRLHEVAFHVPDHGPTCSLVGGGVIVTIEHNAAQTPEGYAAELQAWRERHIAEQERAAEHGEAVDRG